MFSLQNKTTIITGGGSGIGKAIAMLFAQQGATVHIIELDAEAASATVDEIRYKGGSAFGHACDVSKQQQVVNTFNSIDKVDILVNNAGIAHIGTAVPSVGPAPLPLYFVPFFPLLRALSFAALASIISGVCSGSIAEGVGHCFICKWKVNRRYSVSPLSFV